MQVMGSKIACPNCLSGDHVLVVVPPPGVRITHLRCTECSDGRVWTFGHTNTMICRCAAGLQVKESVPSPDEVDHFECRLCGERFWAWPPKKSPESPRDAATAAPVEQTPVPTPESPSGAPGASGTAGRIVKRVIESWREEIRRRSKQLSPNLLERLLREHDPSLTRCCCLDCVQKRYEARNGPVIAEDPPANPTTPAVEQAEPEPKPEPAPEDKPAEEAVNPLPHWSVLNQECYKPATKFHPAGQPLKIVLTGMNRFPPYSGHFSTPTRLILFILNRIEQFEPGTYNLHAKFSDQERTQWHPWGELIVHPEGYWDLTTAKLSMNGVIDR